MNDTSSQKLKLAVELFLKGEPLTYKDVEFLKVKDRALHICSYSECAPELVNSEMAKEAIEKAKAILTDLSEKSHEFRGVAQRMPHENYFLYSYGNGSFVLAKEIAGVFESDFPNATR